MKTCIGVLLTALVMLPTAAAAQENKTYVEARGSVKPVPLRGRGQPEDFGRRPISRAVVRRTKRKRHGGAGSREGRGSRFVPAWRGNGMRRAGGRELKALGNCMPWASGMLEKEFAHHII